MATKTLILRPTSITCDNQSLVTLYPSSVTMDNAHTLVNEEVADDDATYLTGGLGSKITYSFNYIEPDDLMSITGMRCVVRYKLESGTKSCSLSLEHASHVIGGSVSYTGINTSTYTDTEYILNGNGLNTVNDLLVDTGSSEILILRLEQTVNSNSSKGNPVRTTQVYIEITYEAEEAVETDLIYLKKDNIYTQVNYSTIYKKVFDIWKPVGIDCFSSNSKYVIKEVE